MKTLSKFLVLLMFCVICGAIASADVYNITMDNGAPGCSSGTSCGTVTTTLNSGTIHVVISLNSPFGIFGNNDAFGFNVVGSTLGLTMSNFSNSNFNGSGGSGNEDGWGTFAFRVSGPGGSGAISSLSFDVTRTGGFSSVTDIAAGASNGGNGPTTFAMHLRDNSSGLTGFAGVTPDSPRTQVPEPASLMLLGTGLSAVAVRLRRRK